MKEIIIPTKYQPAGFELLPEAKVAITAALSAGRAIRKSVGGFVEEKEGMSNVVNEADRASGEVIRKVLRRNLNDEYRILSEEGNERFDDPLTLDRLWIVDELDGSKNYADSISDIAVSIAYAKKGVLKVGVVYNPMRDQLYYAEEGKGAYYMGKVFGSNRWVKQRIHVSKQTQLSQATVETSIAYEVENTRLHDAILHSFHDINLTIRTRQIGSSVIQLCRVAQGFSDLQFHSQLQPWDYAAGYLVIKEAGGDIRRMDGTDFNFMCPDSVAGNKQLIAQFVEALKERNELIKAHLALRERFRL